MKKYIFLILGPLVLGISNPQIPTFLKSPQELGNGKSNDLAVFDFNYDGYPDVFIANGIYNNPASCQLWLNDGSGNFNNSNQDFGAHQTNVAYADLNGDGYMDLFLANGNWNKGDSSYVWLNNGKGIFTKYRSAGLANTSCVALADLDGDGDIDVYKANHPYSDNSGGEDEVWLNDGTGIFTNSGQQIGGSSTGRRVKLADIDGNNTMDAIVLNGGGLANKIWLNDGAGNFVDSGQDLGISENIDLEVQDIDNDNDLDIIIVKGAWGGSPKGIEVFTNDGIGVFSKSQSIGTNDGYGIAMEDLNGDEFLDIVLINGSGQSNQVFVNNRAGSFSLTSVDIGKGGYRAAATDLNNDKIPDIIIINENSPANIWFGQGSLQPSTINQAKK